MHLGEVLGAPWVRLGKSYDPLGEVLRASWEPLGARFPKSAKVHQKINRPR